MIPSTQRAPRSQHRVVVTGVGAVTPVGNSASESWEALMKGKSGIAPITKFDTSVFDVKFAGEVKGFSPDLFVPKKEQKRMDDFTLYSIACAKMALDQSGLLNSPDIENLKRDTGVLVGVGMGGLPTIESCHTTLMEKGPSRIGPFFIPTVISNMAAGQISIQFGFCGPNYSVTSACASGAHSIGEAYRYIRDGLATAMLAGGAESTVCPLAIGGFSAMRALSTRNEAPDKASRPFDKDRDGFVLAEGAGILVLESYEHAKKRGATILCEVMGYGVSSDAYHMTSPAPEGAGASLAMRRCLADAELSAERINYINAHGTSTPVGDELETLAIQKTFADHSKSLWVSSTKSMTGHTLGAAGAIESVFTIQSLIHQVAPPTINLENPSEACVLDYVPGSARQGRIQYALNNSFGFGGTNACLVFGKI